MPFESQNIGLKFCKVFCFTTKHINYNKKKKRKFGYQHKE